MKHGLRLIPFFTDLDETVLEAIERRCFRARYKKGDTIFQEGDYGDRMYLVDSGQIKVVSESNGQEKIYSYLGPGNFFGETALLTGEPRNATVRVVIDTELIVLPKRDFEDLLKQHPSLGLNLSRELGRRLTRTLHEPVQTEQFNLVSVVGPRAISLAQELARITGEEVLIFDMGGMKQVNVDLPELARQNVLLARASDTLGPDELALRLSTLVQEYYWIIFSLPLTETPLTRKAAELADVTVQISNDTGDWRHPASKDFWRVRDNPVAIARVARRICQRQVGIALSSGNARGFAHIGVLKVLQEEGIPIDMIAATSIGAIFAALFAAGRSTEQILEFAMNVQRQYNFFTGFRYWDFGIPPRSGLIRGKATHEYIRKWLEDRSFADLEMPVHIVATDAISGEEVVFNTGPVADAVRASISVIGVFEPARIGHRFLIDGGAVNPVPTSVLQDKGCNIIIASSVIPNLQDRLHRKQARAAGKPPNVFGIVLGALEIMESEIIKTRMSGVHVLIKPDIARYTTLDYSKAQEIIKLGEEAARAEVANIKQLLAPRPRKRDYDR